MKGVKNQHTWWARWSFWTSQFYPGLHQLRHHLSDVLCTHGNISENHFQAEMDSFVANEAEGSQLLTSKIPSFFCIDYDIIEFCPMQM